MNPQLTNALIAAARAFADSLEASSGRQTPPVSLAATVQAGTKTTTKPAPAAKPEPVAAPAPEPVKEPEVSFDEPAEITLDSLKAKYKPLVQHENAEARKKYQGLIGKWMIEHGAKAISEIKPGDYAEFDAFLTQTATA